MSKDGITVNKDNIEAVTTAVKDLAEASQNAAVTTESETGFASSYIETTHFTEFKNWLVGSDGKSGVLQAVTDEALRVSENEVTINVDNVETIIDAVSRLATAASKIPTYTEYKEGIFNTTEWIKKSDFDGMKTWVNDIIPIVSSIGKDAEGNDLDIDTTSITLISSAIKTLAEASKNIPTKEESWFGLWTKTADWDGFKTNAPKLAEGLSGFTTNLGDVNLEAMSTGSTAVSLLSAAANNVMAIDSTSFATAVSTFCNETNGAPALGGAMKAFSDKAEGINTSAIGLVADALFTITDVVAFLDGYVYVGIDVATFKAKIVEIATAVKDFSEQFPDVDPSGAVSTIASLITMLSSMNGVDYTGATSFPETLKKLAETSLKGFVDTFGGDEATTAVTDAISGLTSVGAGAAKSSTAYDDFYAAGKYCVEGLAAGIGDSDAVAKVIAAAVAAVRAAITAAEDEAGIASPAKEFIRIATYCGMGLTKGFSNYESKTYDSGRRLADSARAGLSDAISRVSDIIDSGIDAQPTIRPVLDLTDVSAGANRINSLFGTPSVGVMSRVGAISSMMNGIQNGSNNDVIAAINDLGSRIGDRPGDTYNINGITYDDGSNITSAVEALIRAAIRERRA